VTVWNLMEWTAWALSALIAAWMAYDAMATSRRYSEEFLTHTMEDLVDADFTGLDGSDLKGVQS
jgi:hypothetical protein